MLQHLNVKHVLYKHPKWELYSLALLDIVHVYTPPCTHWFYNVIALIRCLVVLTLLHATTITVTIALLVVACVCGFLLAVTLLVMVIVLVTSLRQRKKIQHYKQLTTNEEI